jgi:hypothetical protein
MLSKEALKWLESINYQQFNHDQRMILLKAAMIAYPNNNKEEE